MEVGLLHWLAQTEHFHRCRRSLLDSSSLHDTLHVVTLAQSRSKSKYRQQYFQGLMYSRSCLLKLYFIFN